MRHLVARSQLARNYWRLWSEVTSSLPDVTVIGEGEPLPPDTFVIHTPTTRADVALAERDLLADPEHVIVCAIGKDEEVTIGWQERPAIDGLWSRYGRSGRCFGTIGDAAEWVGKQLEPATA